MADQHLQICWVFSIFRVICGASNAQCTHFLFAKKHIFGGFLEPVSPSSMGL
jgi:hypothetical protein